ncbi:MAG: class I SAM-dependent methyltransferase [Armatimonadetes bacterium]|nr:class I SAM-dependent methyltransferase [Armatimonadota bacterium]
MNEPWYETYFGADYLSIYRLADTAEQLALLEGLLAPFAGGRILDLPCGHGRHSVPLAQRGFQMVGVDLSSVFLNVALSAARAARTPARFARGDMRAMPVGTDSVDAAICMFTSLGYFDSDDQHLGVLREFARVVRPGGALVLDLANIDAVRAQADSAHWTKDGVEVSSHYSFDESAKRARTERLVTFADGRTAHYESSVRLFEEAEILDLLSAAGWRVSEQLGSYAGGSVSPRLPRRILVCWLAAV